MSPRGGGHGGMMIQGRKPKNFKGTLRRLLSYLKPRRKRITAVFIAAIFSTLFAIIGPKVMGEAITVLFEGAYAKFQGNGTGIDFGKVGRLLVILVILYVFSSLFNFLQQYLMASVAQRTVYDLREAVFAKLDQLPIRYFDEHSTGDTLSRVSNDIDTIGTTLQQSLTQLVTSIVTIVGIIVMMLTISPLLTLIAVVSLPLSIFVIQPIDRKSVV